MSSEEVELVRLKRRGDRVLEVRNSLAMSGDEFATAINKRGLAHGYEAGYDKSKVSRLEKGKTSFFLAEDAAIIAA
ncbi:MAG TPA: hypothetical protein VN085_06005, partial [Vicinamibacterales bacterium]|nr:hypothetical protein [Vicinamibacterales bacterium]